MRSCKEADQFCPSTLARARGGGGGKILTHERTAAAAVAAACDLAIAATWQQVEVSVRRVEAVDSALKLAAIAL